MIRLGNDEHRRLGFIEENRIKILNKIMAEVLKNFLLSNVQSNQTVLIGNVFIPTFDEDFWKRTSASLIIQHDTRFNADQLAALEKGTIMAYADDLPLLVETLEVAYTQTTGILSSLAGAHAAGILSLCLSGIGITQSDAVALAVLAMALVASSISMSWSPRHRRSESPRST